MECPHCRINHEDQVLRQGLMVCPDCGWHLRISPQDRISYIADENSFVELFKGIKTNNPIDMEGYEEKIEAAKAKTSLDEAVVTGSCTIEGRPVLLGIMSFDFMGGSMGSVVGEKISRLMLKGAEDKIPVIIYTTSGGARMQEGLFSLMQMAKTSSAAARLDEEGVPYFVMLCDPTTGGVTASFAMLGDIICAEPGALIGFAGPRVIEGTIKQKLPEGFQRAEFQQQKGFVDCIVPRSQQRAFWVKMIDAHKITGKENR
ncbi:MAG: acetyl-CoA carboxylase, carboxyltransferase subunit beta [Treponemataceae bacterium]|nr:acetyl-CoA carboxylase, carboxyltransferase subunit beta [Treponemataceae bacterium]